jgi:hypothetical protein
MNDRLYIAAEVTRRLNYIRHDTRELARLLRGETLSAGFHETLLAVIGDLQKLADAAKPDSGNEQPLAEPATPSEPPNKEKARRLERADVA